MARTLRNHLDIDIVLTKHAEELARDTNQILQLLTDKAHNRHIRYNINSTEAPKLNDSAIEILVLDLVLILSSATQKGRLRVQRHGDMHLRRGNEIYGEM